MKRGSTIWSLINASYFSKSLISLIVSGYCLFLASCNPINNTNSDIPTIIDTAFSNFKVSESTYGTYRADYKIFYIGLPADTIIIDHVFDYNLNSFCYPLSNKEVRSPFVVEASKEVLCKDKLDIEIFVDTQQRIIDKYVDPENPLLLEYYPIFVKNLSDSNNLYLPMYRGYGFGLQIQKENKMIYPEMGVDCGTHFYSIMVPPGMILISGVKKYKEAVKTIASIHLNNVKSNEFELGIHEEFFND